MTYWNGFNFQIGDQVEYNRHNSDIPFGARGKVEALSESEVSVRFQEEIKYSDMASKKIMYTTIVRCHYDSLKKIDSWLELLRKVANK